MPLRLVVAEEVGRSEEEEGYHSLPEEGVTKTALDSVRGEVGDLVVQQVETALPAFSSSNGRRRQWRNRFFIAQ